MVRDLGERNKINTQFQLILDPYNQENCIPLCQFPQKDTVEGGGCFQQKCEKKDNNINCFSNI